MQGDALRVGPELDDVAVSAQAKPTADHLHPSGDEQAAAPFGLVCVMAAGVVELAFDGAAVLRPLLFQMDERHWRRQKQKCWMPDRGSQSSGPAIRTASRR